MNQSDAISALIRLIDHATEAHPHFECPRGQHDIAQARAALDALIVLIQPWDRLSQELAVLDDRIAERAARVKETTYI